MYGLIELVERVERRQQNIAMGEKLMAYGQWYERECKAKECPGTGVHDTSECVYFLGDFES